MLAGTSGHSPAAEKYVIGASYRVSLFSQIILCDQGAIRGGHKLTKRCYAGWPVPASARGRRHPPNPVPRQNSVRSQNQSLGGALTQRAFRYDSLMFMRLRHLLGWVLWRHFPKFTKGQEKEMMEMKLKTGTGTTADTAAEEVIPKGRSFSDQLRATSGGGRSDSSYYVITPGVPAIWELTPRYGRMNVVKSPSRK